MKLVPKTVAERKAALLPDVSTSLKFKCIAFIILVLIQARKTTLKFNILDIVTCSLFKKKTIIRKTRVFSVL